MIETENLFICCICAFLIVVMTVVGFVNYNDNATMARMVKDGANPVAAYCAVKGVSTTNTGTCARAISG